MSALLSKTREMLLNRPKPVTYTQIETETGLSVRWLEALATGQIADPGVGRIEKLYCYLAGKSLDV